MIRLARIPGLFLLTAAALFLLRPGNEAPSSGADFVQSREQAFRTERRSQTLAVFSREHPDLLPSMNAPGLEYYIYPRTYNSPVPINAGRWSAYTALRAENARLALRKQALANAWTSLGPNNIGGRMRALAFDPNDPNVVYAGAASGGAWKSYDGGSSWSPLSDFLPTLAVGAVAVDRNNSQRVFIGTGEGAANWDAVYGNGIYMSGNGGGTWTNIFTIVPNYDQVCNALALHPAGSDTLLAAIAYQKGNSGGVFKTTDGGGHWVNVLSGFARDVFIDPNRPSRVIAALGYDGGGGSNGIYRSDAGGTRFTFTHLTNGLPAADSIARIRLAASPSKPDAYIAVIVRPGRYYGAGGIEDLLGIYRTTNGGDNWERMPCSDYTDMKRFMATSQAQGFYDLSLAFHPTDHTTIYTGGIHNWRSTNFGLTFAQVSNDQSVHVDQHAIAFSPADPNTMLVGNDGGIFRTRNDKATVIPWENCNTNLVTFQFYAMDYDRLNPTRVYGGTQDNGTNRGDVGNKNWIRVLGGDGMTCAVDPTNSSIVYAESQYGNIQKSYDGGSSFVGIKSGISYTVSPHWLAPFLIHPATATTLLFGSNMVYRTTNGGGQWVPISSDLTNSNNSFSQCTHIAIARSNGNVAYVVTGNARCWKSTNILAAFDAVTWTRVGNGASGLPALYLTQVAIDPTNENVAYVATSSFDSTRNGLYGTTDGGTTWIRKVPVGGDGRTIWRYGPINCVAVLPRDPNTVFVGTDVGVFVSLDRGNSWRPFGDGLPVVVVDDIRLTNNDVIYAATHGRGMWMASSIVSAKAEPPAPGALALEQNYPNPFNPATTIAFTLPARRQVTLALYDRTGRLVRTLLEGMREAGTHRIAFDGSGLASGIYFYSLRSGSETLTRKMVLLK